MSILVTGITELVTNDPAAGDDQPGQHGPVPKSLQRQRLAIGPGGDGAEHPEPDGLLIGC